MAETGLEITERIDGGSADSHLEVKVWPRAEAGASDIADDLALAYRLPDRHSD